MHRYDWRDRSRLISKLMSMLSGSSDILVEKDYRNMSNLELLIQEVVFKPDIPQVYFSNTQRELVEEHNTHSPAWQYAD